MKSFLVCLFLFGLAAARPRNSCRSTLLNAGFSENFNETVAHAVHSMTVQGLRMFNPRSTVDNRVPTVNMDRRSPDKVIPFAPEDALGSDFKEMTMKTIDKILSNIGKDNDGLGPNWSPLERVVHRFHMWDVWYQVHEIFENKVLRNPPKAEVCSCLMDTANNGIYQAVKWVSDHYDSGTPITLLNRPIPKLTDSSSWAIWKARLLYYYKDQSLEDAAQFIYCATKDF